MVKPKNTEATQLKELIQQLTEAAETCDYSPGARGYIARTNVAGIAKDIVRLMMAPSDMSMHHSVNVSVSVFFAAAQRLKRCVTDSRNGMHSNFDGPGSP
jgi:hypothetical protein